MATDPLLATSSTTGGTASTAAASKLSEDYETFLKLLTAQLSNQDPLEPMDSSAFVTQLAQLSQVEQAISTNTNLETISAQLANASMLAEMALVGKSVTVPSSKVVLKDGATGFGYAIATPARSVKAEIYGSDGTLIRTFNDLPATAAGIEHVTWDGLDRQGLPVPDGTFSVKITALDSEGESIVAAPYATSPVTRVSFEQGLTLLRLANGDSAYSAQVVAVE